MGCLLVWENKKWYYDRITNRNYDHKQPRPPIYKVGDVVEYRGDKVKVEWCNLTINDVGDRIFWYDVRKGNFHSVSCLEEDLKPLDI